MLYKKASHPKLDEQIALYSNETIPEGSIVFNISDLPIISKNDRYAITLTSEKYLNTVGTDIMYLNHSCDPTLSLDKEKLNFVASKTIKAGDMLTFDYNTTELSITSPFRCVCGSDKCRGQIC